MWWWDQVAICKVGPGWWRVLFMQLSRYHSIHALPHCTATCKVQAKSVTGALHWLYCLRQLFISSPVGWV